MFRRSAFTLPLLALLLSPNALAWGELGHEIIGQIAQDRLAGPKTTALLTKLLGPGFSLAKLSTCADNIREAQRNRAPLRPDCVITPAELASLPSTDNWHHINIPVPAPSSNRRQVFDAAAADRKPRVVQLIEEQTVILRNHRLPAHQRALALMWLCHFVGDLHQPLHAVARNSDKGGNDVKVELPNGGTTNLHSIWDSGILRLIPNAGTKASALVSPAMASSRRAFDWAWESFDLAVTQVYQGVPLPAGPEQEVSLPANYMQAKQPVVLKRLAEGGVRLAELIRANLKK
jgi:hypothetical protein